MRGQNLNECNCLEICENKIRLLLGNNHLTFKGGKAIFLIQLPNFFYKKISACAKRWSGV